ncbi:hypothetical protein BKG68_12565 [Mycobacteroides saopaulense]|uniref:Terminase small subunit n=1 Tax=Mycobacteroides saopaulense TaxID=1578165 RepID=A0ABX3BYE0_9MYCO|nr:hypothetical protein BKG68_12565 [Mycobacteroides saopaulense]OHU08767.1 hypothetical protein BKG73_17255 [Mycobacteroides saopaulense]
MGDNEQAPKPKSVAEAAKSGTQRELLVAMRDRIAETVTLANCPPRELGVLTKRLQDIARDIAQLDAIEDEQSTAHNGPVDDTYDSSAI